MGHGARLAVSRRFRASGVDNAYKSDLTETSSADTWETPGLDYSGASEVAVTFRAFGTPRVFYGLSSSVEDNVLGMFQQATGSILYPKARTSLKDKADLYLGYRESEDSSTIDLYQVNP